MTVRVKRLFVGGPLDGRFTEVEHAMPVIVAVDQSDDEVLSFNKVRYHAEKVRMTYPDGFTQVWTIFLCESWPMSDSEAVRTIELLHAADVAPDYRTSDLAVAARWRGL
jgi:hypothetical protein